jgi:hypothetical protein
MEGLWLRLQKAGKGWKRLGEAHCLVPLSEKVSFATKLQRRNRLQVSKYVRWKYKLETYQTLKVSKF